MPRQQFVVQEYSSSKSKGKRFLSSIRSFVLGLFVLFCSFVGIGLLGWLLQTLFPQHTPGRTGRNQASVNNVPADVQNYFNAVGAPVNASGRDLAALMQLSSEASAKPSLVASAEWQKKAAAACAALESDGNALQTIRPVPGDCEAMDEDARRMGARFAEIASDYRTGVDIKQLDKDAIRRAAKATHIVLEQDDKALVADANAIRTKYRK